MLYMTVLMPIKSWSSFTSMDYMLSEIEAEFALILSMLVEMLLLVLMMLA